MYADQSTMRLGAAEPDTPLVLSGTLLSFLVALRKRRGAVTPLTRNLHHSMISDLASVAKFVLIQYRAGSQAGARDAGSSPPCQHR